MFQNAIRHIYTILRNITTKNYCTNPDNPTNGGKGEQRSPVSFPTQLLDKTKPSRSPKRAVAFLQSRNCAVPLQVFGQVSAAAKSLRSLRIYVLLWDRIAVQIVLLRYFFCLISYFYMLLILQSAPSRLAPIEALPHTPQGLCPLTPQALWRRAPACALLLASLGGACTLLVYSSIIYFSAEESAFAPSAAAVITCLKGVVRTSPAAKNPSADVTPSSPAFI